MSVAQTPPECQTLSFCLFNIFTGIANGCLKLKSAQKYPFSLPSFFPNLPVSTSDYIILVPRPKH